jgi:hypothetical protein
MRERPMVRATHRRIALRTVLLGVGLALIVASGALAKFGSSYTHPCDETIYSECVANNATHSVSIYVTGTYATQVRWVMSVGK